MRSIIRGAVVLLGAVALALLGPAAMAEAATGATAQDAAFLRAAHQSNLAEITTGKLAQRKGRSAEVRDLGRMWVELGAGRPEAHQRNRRRPEGLTAGRAPVLAEDRRGRRDRDPGAMMPG